MKILDVLESLFYTLNLKNMLLNCVKTNYNK